MLPELLEFRMRGSGHIEHMMEIAGGCHPSSGISGAIGLPVRTPRRLTHRDFSGWAVACTLTTGS